MASIHLINTIATIAAKAAKYLGNSFTDEAAVDFAWWSISEEGDASYGDDDFGQHIRAWVAEIKENGMLDTYRPL